MSDIIVEEEIPIEDADVDDELEGVIDDSEDFDEDEYEED
jgi:hypothetical protein